MGCVGMRELSYSDSLNEAFHQILEKDEKVYMIGGGITSPWYVGQTTKGLIDKFGKRRVIDSPTSENGITGIATGSSIAGLHPIVCYPRHDFMYLAADQICNMLANWRYMNGGNYKTPVVLWAIINRGGEQAAQHSQALHSFFSHIPGLKVVAPSNAFDVKGLMATCCLKEQNPIVFVDDRWNYPLKSYTPKELYFVPLGQAIIHSKGNDGTVVSSSYLTNEVIKAGKELEGKYKLDIFDLVTLKPFDDAAIIKSVKKTGKLIVVDGGWKTCGYAAEIIATVAENVQDARFLRITLPNTPAPACSKLEELYYITSKTIVDKVDSFLKRG